MAGTWRRLQSTRRIVRWPIKWGIFAVVFLLTLYPHPNFLRRHIQHLRGLDRLPDSAEPALAPLAARFRSYLEDQGVSPSDGPALLAAVNRFVHREVPYAWDWEVWGVADYLPTVAEVVARGREDCDGRAVVAAALLRGENIPAELVKRGARIRVGVKEVGVLRRTFGDVMPGTLVAYAITERAYLWTIL
ncbi:MAG: hypothetical protein HY718_18930, partial [Planctomycetes bacterium]|nr:hypothetical protein [Planctomycetota bacterium]